MSRNRSLSDELVCGHGRQSRSRAAIAERLASVGHVVVIDREASVPFESDRIDLIVGDASDEPAAMQAAAVAEDRGPLVGWVNNAAVFPDASLLVGDG